MLDLNRLEVFYGEAQALWSISLNIKHGEIVTLLGSNGSGKTTTLKAISGILLPKRGEIRFNELRIDGSPPYEIARNGIAHILEGRGLFPNMTVLDNLTIGAYIPKAWRMRKKALQKVLSLFPILQERSRQVSGTLSGGEQQMVAIARGLMGDPELLMLDEPSLGLAPIIVEQIFAILRNISRDGVTMLLVEQNAAMALQLADRGYVLETGRIILSGKTSELLENEQVKRAYLGLYEEIE